MLFDWLTGRKAKEVQKHEKAEHEKAVQESEQKRRQIAVDLWTSVLSMDHYSDMSLDDFDSSSIESIYDIVNEEWAWWLQRDPSNQKDNQTFLAYESDGETYYKVIFYKPHDVGRRTINFGELSEGLSVVRGRFELADKIIRKRIKPEAEKKKERLSKLLEE